MADAELNAYASLSADVNKQKGAFDNEIKEGIVSEKLSELDLKMSDDDLIKLTNKWEKAWKDSDVKSEWEKKMEENENYWLGKQFDQPKADKSRPLMDNLIFESVETYLPRVTKRNPEPLVSLNSSEIDIEGNSDPRKLKYVDKVKAKLIDLADENKFRLKLKKVARHWAIFLIGIGKVGWDLDTDAPILRIVRPRKIILDPDATIDEDGYTGNRIGEYRKIEASRLIKIIGGDEEEPTGAVKAIKDLVKEDLATDIQFIEWWTSEFMCWKMGKNILLKKKNPHWNYDQEIPQEQVDNYGNTTQISIPKKGINHFVNPQMPYIFLTVFNLGDQPVDKTSLIGQNLSNQDLINKRNKQIDKNADRMNGGMVVSLARSGLTQSQAKGVSESLRKGGVVAIPDGTPREAIDTYSPTALPADVFTQLSDIRSRLRDIFGIKGSSQAGLESEQTVRGKILSTGLDTDRIGGGVSEYLEQYSSDVYNWFLQLLYVYDLGFQFIEGAIPPKVKIAVKEGSLIPKDSFSIANQAMELAGMNRIANIDLYKRLEFPNPEELAANVWLETNAPQLLYKDNPTVMEAMGMMQASAMQQAQQEQSNKQQEFGQEMEKQKMKEEGQTTRSILSAIPMKKEEK